VVVTIAIVASAIISLTLTPTLCARLPPRNPDADRKKEPIFERAFEVVLGGYGWMLDLCLRAKPVKYSIGIEAASDVMRKKREEIFGA
jgi:HAE1 family hydrophobic/amphiphilic exporter-1